MNTTYKPVDQDFLEMLAAAKARGVTWVRLVEITNKPIVELEIIPWREPKAWAKACKYAEKLVAHETLSETTANLRTQMNDNANNARIKTQVANSIVRVVQLQHLLRTPKKPKNSTVRAHSEPTPTANESATIPPRAPTTTPTPTTTRLATIVAVMLFMLVGVLACWSLFTAQRPNVFSAIVGPVGLSNAHAQGPVANSDGDDSLRTEFWAFTAQPPTDTTVKQGHRLPVPIENQPILTYFPHIMLATTPVNFTILTTRIVYTVCWNGRLFAITHDSQHD